MLWNAQVFCAIFGDQHIQYIYRLIYFFLHDTGQA